MTFSFPDISLFIAFNLLSIFECRQLKTLNILLMSNVYYIRLQNLYWSHL